MHRAVCRLLPSQFISVARPRGRSSVSHSDQEKEQGKSQCQLLAPGGHREFAKGTGWRAVDCSPELRQSRGIIDHLCGNTDTDRGAGGCSRTSPASFASDDNMAQEELQCQQATSRFTPSSCC